MIERIKPHELIPHPDNSMKHGNQQLTQLVASFEQFGFNGVIVIDENNVVLAGHGRRLAAIRMGMETVPCLRRAGLTDAQKRSYIIADNQIGRSSEWDEDVLSQQLEMLSADGFDLSSLGISTAALASIQDPDETTAAESHWINLLNAYMHRKSWCDTRYCFAQAPGSTFFRPGGQTQHRTLETELADTLFLRRMFGQAIQIKRTRGDAAAVHPYQRSIINPL